MVQYKLSNPLTIEEKLQVNRLIGHDSTIYFTILNGMRIGSPDVNKEKFYAIVEHLGSVEATIVSLTQAQNVYLQDKFNVTSFDKWSLEIIADNLSKALVQGKLDASIEGIDNFLSLKPLMHSVLYNLAKNGVNAQLGTEDKDEPVNLNVYYHSGFPENTLFIPEGAKDYANFIAFDVHNKGKSFPKDIPLESYFTSTAPEKGEGGFGLYFTKLAAKFLRAPVNITSEPGDTTVLFYHPIYVDLKQNK